MGDMLLIVDVQASFQPSEVRVQQIAALARRLSSASTVERHDDARVPFARQLGCQPAPDDQPERSGALGAKLWRHHFGAVLTSPDALERR